MTMRFASEQPPYRQVAAELRHGIADGLYQPGDRLPSNRELQEAYGIASGTAQSAMKLLKAEGLAHSVPGRGSFVRSGNSSPASPPPPDTPPTPSTPGELSALAAEIRTLTTHIAQLTSALRASPHQAG